MCCDGSGGQEVSLICIYRSILDGGLVEIQVSLKRVLNNFVYMSLLWRAMVPMSPLKAEKADESA